MWKSTKTRAEQQLAAAQKRDQSLIRQKELVEKERDDRMARLRKLRLAREAAEMPPAAQAPEEVGEKVSETPGAPRPVRVHPHRS